MKKGKKYEKAVFFENTVINKMIQLNTAAAGIPGSAADDEFQGIAETPAILGGRAFHRR